MDDKTFSQLGKRIPISNVIAEQIEEAILNKKFEAGSKLPSEAELCKQFGVSRTSVREALQILNTHGMISIEKGKGLYVKNISSESVSNSILKFFEHRLEGNYAIDVIHARQIIEPGIAYFAALNRTDEDLCLLQHDIEGIKNNIAGSVEIHTRFDMSFHLHMANASKNKLMPLLLKPIHKLLPAIKSSILKNVDDARESAVIYHQKIFDYVERKDAEGAKNAMIEHLEIAEQHVLNAFKD